jgi:ribosomal protein S18 acetylase RimI-like enzyme
VTVQARRATADDLAAVSLTLAGAFHHDSLWGWAFSDASRRREQYLAWFAVEVGSAISHGWVWTTPGHEAVAVWMPPGCPGIDEAEAAALGEVLRREVGPAASLILEIMERFDRAHPRQPEHYYLSLLGTHPEHRGSGLGMDLLRANLALLDAEGSPAYLESTNPSNLGRYESVGFQVADTIRLPAGGPDVTTMWREPQPRHP